MHERYTTKNVATREGGVDRNDITYKLTPKLHRVATREGGVDRNTITQLTDILLKRRHPRGWRG